MTSDITETVADGIEGRMEINRTEHQLYCATIFNRLVEDLQETGDISEEDRANLILVGADVKALFPNMPAENSGKLLNEYTCSS